MSLITRHAAESTITYLRWKMVQSDDTYPMAPATLIWWLETIIALHTALEAAGITVPDGAAEAAKG